MNTRRIVGAALAASTLTALGFAGFERLELQQARAALEIARTDYANVELRLLSRVGEPMSDDPEGNGAPDERPASPAGEVEPLYVLDPQPNLARSLHELESFANDAGVLVEEVRASDVSTSPGVQIYELECHGTPAAVCAFLAAVESAENLTVVQKAGFAPRDTTELALRLAVARYHEIGGGE